MSAPSVENDTEKPKNKSEPQIILGGVIDLEIESLNVINLTPSEIHDNKFMTPEIGEDDKQTGEASFTLIPVNTEFHEPANYYICGPSGTGKTSLARNIMLSWQSQIKNSSILVVSDKSDMRSLLWTYTDETEAKDIHGSPYTCLKGRIDKTKVRHLPIDEIDVCIENIKDENQLADTLFIFDDANNETNDNQKSVEQLQNRILHHGRVNNICSVIIRHLIVGRKTQAVRAESYATVLFIQKFFDTQTRRYLEYDMKLKDKEIRRLEELVQRGNIKRNGRGWFAMVKGSLVICPDLIFSLGAMCSDISNEKRFPTINHTLMATPDEGGSENVTSSCLEPSNPEQPKYSTTAPCPICGQSKKRSKQAFWSHKYRCKKKQKANI